MGDSPSTNYILNDTPHAAEQRRLRQLEAEWNGKTTRHLDQLGVQAGWRCLEVGAGAGGVAAWLAERVGPRGHVLATDINPRFLADAGLPAQVTIATHDIESDALAEAEFDLVHCRLVLIHLRDPGKALRKMLRALRPGGWLLVEESSSEPRSVPGYLGYSEAECAGFDQTSRGIFEALRGLGMDVWLGRRLPAIVRALEVDALGAEESSNLVFGGSPASATYTGAAQMLRDMVLAKGLLTAEAVDSCRSAFSDPRFAFFSPNILSVWARRPLEPGRDGASP